MSFLYTWSRPIRGQWVQDGYRYKYLFFVRVMSQFLEYFGGSRYIVSLSSSATWGDASRYKAGTEPHPIRVSLCADDSQAGGIHAERPWKETEPRLFSCAFFPIDWNWFRCGALSLLVRRRD